eukprot:m.18087 g.18087  ORF g.18087 m.18087 type:complete len:140 (+) comp8078_c0_seq1:2-421(+)
MKRSRITQVDVNDADLVALVTSAVGPDISFGDDVILDRFMCKGYLLKQGDFFRSTWDKRWFVVDLRAKRLYFYSSDAESAWSRTTFMLAEVIKAVGNESAEGRATHAFMIVTVRRTFQVRAPSRPAMLAWLEVLNAVAI